MSIAITLHLSSPLFQTRIFATRLLPLAVPLNGKNIMAKMVIQHNGDDFIFVANGDEKTPFFFANIPPHYVFAIEGSDAAIKGYHPLSFLVLPSMP